MLVSGVNKFFTNTKPYLIYVLEHLIQGYNRVSFKREKKSGGSGPGFESGISHSRNSEDRQSHCVYVHTVQSRGNSETKNKKCHDIVP